MKKTVLLLAIFTLLTIVSAYSVHAYNSDFYLVNNWFDPDEIWAKDTPSGDWHDFLFPPNSDTHWDYIKFAKNHGLGVDIEYYLDNQARRRIIGVSTF